MILTFLVLTVLSSDVTIKETSDTGVLLIVNIPDDGPDRKENTYAVPARFGIPDYNGSKKGKVRVLVGTDNPDGCKPFDTSSWPNYNPLENSIVFVHRGACKFVEKVKHAEDAGIAAVVVIDHEGEGDNPVTMSPPDDFTHSTVTISAVAITHSFGQKIVNAYNANQDNVMIASIEWRVPLSNGKVKLELFTSSNDAEDMDFKRK